MTAMRISVVVPGIEGGGRVAETLGSLEEQGYPSLEVVVERSPGDAISMAEALNAGFARATGDVLAYLKPGEVLVPQSLQRVANAFEKEGTQIVMGRSLIVVDESFVEHPRDYSGPFDHLAIWKRRWNGVPQASVFWRRAVHDRCGPFEPGPPFALDYDFICRAGSLFEFHPLDEILSAVPLDAIEGRSAISEAEQLALLIETSRRHWGSWLRPLRWRCELSFLRYRNNAHERARHHARRGEKAALEGHCLEAAARFASAWRLAPAMARGRWKVVRDLCGKRRYD